MQDIDPSIGTVVQLRVNGQKRLAVETERGTYYDFYDHYQISPDIEKIGNKIVIHVYRPVSELKNEQED